MAFTQGIHFSNRVTTLSTGGYVAAGNKTYSSGLHLVIPEISFSSGGYVATGNNTYSRGIHFILPVFSLSSLYIKMPEVIVFSGGVHCTFYGMPAYAGDDTVHISFGIAIDFRGFPRIGQKPLAVQFEQLCRGAIKQFFWQFGTGEHSYGSDPSYIYKNVGIYDVSLRVRIGNLYYTATKKRYIIVLAGDLIVSKTNTAIRCAITKDQGIGMYKLPVTNMPMPEARVGILSIIDSDGVARGLILDSSTGKWYDVTTRKTNTTSKIWTGIDGANLDRSFIFNEDKSRREGNMLRFKEGHLGIVPIEEENRDLAGYDENGFPDGMTVSLEAYLDGEPAIPYAKIDNIPFDDSLLVRGDLRSDRKIEAARIQWRVETNRGAHLITNWQRMYVHSQKSAAPAMRTMVESDYQRELTNVLMWPGIINGILRNRRTGWQITADYSAVTGLDGRTNSAARFDATIYLNPAAVVQTLMFWATEAVTVLIGTTPVAMTAHGSMTYAGKTWTLYHADALGLSGTISIEPSVETDLFDLRAFAASLSVAARGYYFDNVNENEGKVVLPL